MLVNPVGRATRRFVTAYGFAVRRGPFSGLVYPANAPGSVACLVPKLLGCYESELSTLIASSSHFDLFVDIGSADGYYCVGFKRLFPQTAVIGYETVRSARRLARRLAQLNGISFKACGRADQNDLNNLPHGRLLLMIDIEGHEYELVNPTCVPRLREATMIIEVHPAVHSDIIEALTSRFTRSHDVAVVRGGTRRIADYPELSKWDETEAARAISEGRPSDALWLVMRPFIAVAKPD